MEHNDKIKDLFSEKLGNFESSVRPELWSNIASQIGTTTTVATVSTGVSLFTKTIIGVSVAAAIGGFSYFAWNNDSQQSPKKDVEVIANKTINIENSPKQSSNQSKYVNQLNIIDENDVINESNEPLGGDFVLPSTEDFMDLVLENKELPISYVQLAESKLPETIAELKPESPVIQEDHIAEDSEKITNSTTVTGIEKVALELPNVFSPNNDGANDYFEIKSNGLTDFSLVVLDISGKLVFQTTESNFKWDGMNQSNEKVKDGTYLYYLTARDSEGKLISRSQRLSITTTIN